MKLFDGLRWARSSGFLGNGTSVEHRMVVCGDDLRLRWSAKLEIHDPFGRSDVVHADGDLLDQVSIRLALGPPRNRRGDLR